MQNLRLRMEGDTLVVAVDLSRSLGKSSSGRTYLVASSGGPATLGGLSLSITFYSKDETVVVPEGSAVGGATGRNVSYSRCGSTLEARVDLTKSLEESSTGKSYILATDRGTALCATTVQSSFSIFQKKRLGDVVDIARVRAALAGQEPRAPQAGSRASAPPAADPPAPRAVTMPLRQEKQGESWGDSPLSAITGYILVRPVPVLTRDAVLPRAVFRRLLRRLVLL